MKQKVLPGVREREIGVAIIDEKRANMRVMIMKNWKWVCEFIIIEL